MWEGSVVFIHIALEASASTQSRSEVSAIPGCGLDGDRYFVTSGVPLNHLIEREFWIGNVLMRGTRLCEPCKHLDDLTQPGVMSGLIHRGGLRAQILSEGVIHVGDTVHLKAS